MQEAAPKTNYRRYDKGCERKYRSACFVGGGILSAEKAYQNCKAGADVIVIGNAIEKNISLITEISKAIHEASE